MAADPPSIARSVGTRPPPSAWERGRQSCFAVKYRPRGERCEPLGFFGFWSHTMLRFFVAAALTVSAPALAYAQQAEPVVNRFAKTEAMIAMRDGVKLYTTV